MTAEAIAAESPVPTGIGADPATPDAEPPAERRRRAAPSAAAVTRLIRWTALVVGLIVGVLLLIWAVTGVDPSTVVREFIAGSVGDQTAIGRTLVRATPLVLVGVGAAAAVRAGAFNVGGEDQMAMGAITAVLALQVLGTAVPAPLLWAAALIAGAVGGAAWAVLPAYLWVRRGVSEILTTLLLNFITVSVLLYLLGLSLFTDPDPNVVTPQGAPIEDRAELPIIWDDTRLHAGVLVALAAVIGFALWSRTTGGLRVDLAGANPNLAGQAGLRPDRIKVRMLLLSAAFAGVAAAVQLMGVSHRVTTGLPGGIGYTGVLVAVLGRSRPIPTAVAAVGFAALVGGGEALEFVDVPRSVVVLVQAIAVIAVAAGTRGRGGAR
jgi:simple sugar transport system permease protein